MGNRILALSAVLLALTGCVSDPEVPDHRSHRFTAQQLYDLGIDYFRGGQFDLAERQFTHALEEQPDYPEATLALANTYYYRAKMLRARAETKGAVTYLNQAIRAFQAASLQMKDSAEPYMGLGMVYLENPAFYPNAIENLEKALTLDPQNQEKNVRAHFYLGSGYGLVGQLEKSKQHYFTYLEIFPAAPDWDQIQDILVDIHRKLKQPYDRKKQPVGALEPTPSPEGAPAGETPAAEEPAPAATPEPERR